jgi:hypothetical protein
MKQIDLNSLLRDIEINHIRTALEHTEENVASAAKLLGLKRTTLIRRISVLNIQMNRPKRTYIPEEKSINNPFLVRHKNNIEDDLWNE